MRAGLDLVCVTKMITDHLVRLLYGPRHLDTCDLQLTRSFLDICGQTRNFCFGSLLFWLLADKNFFEVAVFPLQRRRPVRSRRHRWRLWCRRLPRRRRRPTQMPPATPIVRGSPTSSGSSSANRHSGLGPSRRSWRSCPSTRRARLTTSASAMVSRA